MNVFGYARLSRDSIVSTSIERQRQAIVAFARARDHQLVDIVEDVDVSATHVRLDERPGMDQLRTRIARGEADVILVRLFENRNHSST